MNSAGRLYQVFSTLRHEDPVLHAVEIAGSANVNAAWLSAFGIELHERQDLDDAVSDCTQATRAELALLRSTLISLGVPEEMINRMYQGLREATASRHLEAAARAWRESINTEYITALQWASALLDVVDKDGRNEVLPDLAPLLAQADELIASVERSALPPITREFMLANLRRMRHALRKARVAGIKPIVEAWQTASGTSGAERQSVKSEMATAPTEAREQAERCGGFFDRVRSTISATAKSAKDIGAIADSGSKLVEFIGEVIDNLPS